MYFSIFIQSAKWPAAVLFCLLTYLSAIAQTVENIRTSFDQSKQLMLIYYDLKGLNYKQEIKIIPEITSGGTSLPLKSLSGDFGLVTRGGKNKTVFWDPFKEGINSLAGIQIKIKTEIKDAEIPRFWGAILQGSSTGSFGVKVMQLNRIGFFGGVRVGKKTPYYRYTVNNAGGMDYIESGVYTIGSERRLAGYVITTGPIFQMTRNMYAYLGMGYGTEQLFWQYQSYNFNKNPTGRYWALNETINRKGLTADIGAVVRVGRLLVDLGLSTIQFKSFQIIGGIGLCSKNQNRVKFFM